MDDRPASQDTQREGRELRRRLLFAVPVVVFVAIAVALAIGLGRDPSRVPSPLIGKPAPATLLEAVPGFGPAFDSSDFAGEVTLVNVFASWCVSCRDEHPLLMRLADTEGVRIFGLAYKDDPEDAAGWLTDHGNPYVATGLDLNGRTGIEWGVYGVPETFLVGPDGTIAWKKIGPLTGDDLAAEVLPRVAALQIEAERLAAEQPEPPSGDDVAEIAATGESGVAALPNLAWLDDPVTVPDTEFLIDGEPGATLGDYRGRAVVLNFWATWCPPCREEMPSLDRLAADHGSEDLVVLTMSEDRGDAADQITAFYEEIGATHLGLFQDPNMALSRAMRVFGLPTTLLIDHEGRVVAQLVGTAEWDSPEALDAILPLAEAARSARLGEDGSAAQAAD